MFNVERLDVFPRDYELGKDGPLSLLCNFVVEALPSTLKQGKDESIKFGNEEVKLPLLVVNMIIHEEGPKESTEKQQ